MIAIADSYTDGSWDTWITPQASSQASRPGSRHTKGTQVLFCDGHAKYMKYNDLVDFTGEQANIRQEKRQRWNNDHLPH